MTNTLDGVWELISDTQTGLMMHQGPHHMFMIFDKDQKPMVDPSNPTDSELLAAHRSGHVGAGTFTLDGTAASYTSRLGFTKNNIGQTYYGEFIVDGDHLTEKVGGNTLEWRRIG